MLRIASYHGCTCMIYTFLNGDMDICFMTGHLAGHNEIIYASELVKLWKENSK